MTDGQIVDQEHENVVFRFRSGASYEVGATAIFKVLHIQTQLNPRVEYALPACVLDSCPRLYQSQNRQRKSDSRLQLEYGILIQNNVMDYKPEDAIHTEQYVKDVMEALGGGGDSRFKTEEPEPVRKLPTLLLKRRTKTETR